MSTAKHNFDVDFARECVAAAKLGETVTIATHDPKAMRAFLETLCGESDVLDRILIVRPR